jgi:hypothetical protein
VPLRTWRKLIGAWAVNLQCENCKYLLWQPMMVCYVCLKLKVARDKYVFGALVWCWQGPSPLQRPCPYAMLCGRLLCLRSAFVSCSPLTNSRHWRIFWWAATWQYTRERGKIQNSSVKTFECSYYWWTIDGINKDLSMNSFVCLLACFTFLRCDAFCVYWKLSKLVLLKFGKNALIVLS